MPIYDGNTLIATLDPGVTSYTADAIYGDWKDFQLASFGNMGFPRAFDEVVGGDTVDQVAGESLDRQLFFRNDLGWRLRPPEEDIEITISGDLNPRDSTLPVFIPTIGGFTALIKQRVSSKARILETGVSGLTATESAQMQLLQDLAEADWFFDKSTGLIHQYRRGTQVDLVPPKAVVGEQILDDTSAIQP